MVGKTHLKTHAFETIVHYLIHSMTSIFVTISFHMIFWYIFHINLQVRTAGLGLAVTLSSVEPGRRLLANNCKHIPGGIWAAALSILLDTQECSMVRQQVW